MARYRDFLRNTHNGVRTRITQNLIKAMEDSRHEVIQEVVKDVVNHPISKALKNHSDGFVPRGTLFGFLGFENGSTPVEDLVAFLKSPQGFQMTLNKAQTRSYTGIVGVVSSPTDESMVDSGISTPWGDGRSWPEMLETRVPGLSSFLAKKDYGRSEEGIQLKNSRLTEQEDLKEIQYLSPIFAKARKSFLTKLRRKAQIN